MVVRERRVATDEKKQAHATGSSGDKMYERSDVDDDDLSEDEIDAQEMEGKRDKRRAAKTVGDEQEARPNDQSLTLNVEINCVAWLLFLFALVFRLWRLDYPRNIVFDELHYGKYVSFYMKNIFFFDAQPPFGVQLIALVAYFAGYTGDNLFKSIGGQYRPDVPLKALRFVPALCGSLCVPLVYHLLRQLGHRNRTAILASVLIILENSLLTQSRFILMDNIMIFFVLFGLFALTKLRSHSFLDRGLAQLTDRWLFWLFLSSTSLTLAVSVKFTAFSFYMLAFILIIYDFWWKIADRTVRTTRLFVEGLLYLCAYVIWPVLVYLLVFYAHLSLLTKAGPHDNIMTSAFQASLEGGLASITRGQPLEVIHGSQVTLRHTHGRACWLHSHADVYPIKYADGRGSSHQQQVTCYSFKDVNNWWIIKKPDRDDLVVSEPVERIKHGDVIQLIHGMTSRSLNSHDVAAPMSPANQEVSCYIDYNISMPSQNLWRVELTNRDETNDHWHTIRSKVHLIHVNSSQALKFSGKQLPDWGYNQHEIVTDIYVNQDDTIWNVEEHRYTKISDEKERERDLVDAQFVPLAPTKLTFWEKMKELQYKMLTFDQEVVQEHMYGSDTPVDWFFMRKGIAYWVNTSDNSQIHLLGNLFLWYASLAAVLSFSLLLLFYLLRRRRNFRDISEDYWGTLVNTGQTCLLGMAVYLAPYFITERPLFLHHYLPVVVFKVMVLAVVSELLDVITSVKWITYVFISGVLVFACFCFQTFLPLCYGSGSLNADDVLALRWQPSWQFIIHKP